MDQNSPQYQEALKAGFSPDQINSYLMQKQGGQTQPTAPQFSSGQPAMQQPVQQDPQQQPSTPTPAPQNTSSPWDVRSWLPTIGAVGGGIIGGLIPGLGETGISEVGGAAIGSGLGEALKEKLGGQKLDPESILAQTALGGLGEGAGQLVGKGIGILAGGAATKMAGRAAELTGQITPESIGKILDPVLPDSIQYDVVKKGLTDTINKYGLATGTPEQMIPQARQAVQQLDTAIKSNPAFNNPLNTEAALQDFNSFVQQHGYTNNPEYTSLIKDAQARIENLGNTAPQAESGIVGADGQPMSSSKPPIPPTIADAYALKSQIADDALNSAFAKKLGQRTLTPTENMNMALYNSMKNTIDTQADPAIRAMNQEQGNLFTIGKAYAKAVPKTGNIANFSVKDILPLGVGEAVGGVFGNGAMGMAAGAAADIAGKSPAAMAAGATGAKIVSKFSPNIAGAVGAAAGTGAGTMFSNGQPAIGGTGGAAIPGSTPLPQGIQKDPQTGAINLPPLQAQGVQQKYPYEAYMNDMVKYSGDPAAQDQLTKLYQANKDAADSYINNNQLNGDEQSSMRDAYNLNYLMNSVRTQMASMPPSILYNTPMSKLASMGGQYSQLATAMQMLRADLGKQLQGGVLRGYDITNLNVTPNITDTPQAAKAKLDQVQGLLAQKYMNLYGKYGLNTQTPAGQ